MYVRGDDDKARQYRSLHSVQRHMIDTNQCKMLYDDNEEEYEEYYDYEAAGAAEEATSPGVKNTPVCLMSCLVHMQFWQIRELVHQFRLSLLRM